MAAGGEGRAWTDCEEGVGGGLAADGLLVKPLPRKAGKVAGVPAGWGGGRGKIFWAVNAGLLEHLFV